ncbi:MAG TPA: aminotransferase class III-fold pyridoxal phosphate-dependent enzyme [Kofleriaceae bacterium]|nr:aminotransferase class III-fold pyridoxal phosphate-dependent enzyme [Kofleriaceae bacterium]
MALNAYEQALKDLATTDENVVVMTAENRAALRTLPPLLGPRFIDVGIAEQTMVGMAAGLALRGRKPIVHALACFLTMRAYEFIRTDVGLGNLPVKLVGGVPGFLSDGNGPTHQAIEDVAIMRGIPNMKVFCPADADDLGAALPVLMKDPAPCYIRYNANPASVKHTHLGQPEKIEVLTEGNDVAILSHGILLTEAMEAHRILATMGIKARVMNARMPKPIDEAAVLAAARECELLVTVEDHFLVGGLFSIVSELLALHGVRPRVLPIAMNEKWFRPAMLADVLKTEGFTGEQIAAKIAAKLGRVASANRVVQNASDPTITRSDALWARAKDLIPHGSQTLAKGPGQHVGGVAPKYLAKGKGSHVWDVDGNEYIDMTMAVGPLVLGYADPEIDDAIRKQLDDGITFSLMHPLEVEVAELVKAAVPGAENVRYSKTGCDVTTAAVRVARAFTGRDRVVCCGYHGWHDWYVSTIDRNKGVPEATRELTNTFTYNDLESVRAAVDDQTACVILEPTVFEAPKDGFLAGVKQICAERGALLVFDEMWTGFRVAVGGAQEKYGVTADLATFSKAVANGMPLSLLTGRADVMKLLDKDVFFFTTFGGEALSLAAAAATIPALRRRRVPETLALRGAKLREAYMGLCRELGLDWTKCVGYDARTMVTFDAKAGNPLELKSFVQQELIRRGVLWGGFHNLSWAHSDTDLDYLLGCYKQILPELAKHVAHGTVKSALRGTTIEASIRPIGGVSTKPRKA